MARSRDFVNEFLVQNTSVPQLNGTPEFCGGYRIAAGCEERPVNGPFAGRRQLKPARSVPVPDSCALVSGRQHLVSIGAADHLVDYAFVRKRYEVKHSSDIPDLHAPVVPARRERVAVVAQSYP